MNTIAEQILQARTMKGLDIEDLAQLTGVDSETLMQIEQGVIDPQLSSLTQISKALNCSLEIGDFSI
ncbi:hypothetical protein GCM10008967_29160 [Bacillus carboniphilus]|uniref:HTH cro/C1-type domain-containing protein n=1 Tax=Bacillus carboniphilus TaxID=86663 RepID=A0ABN0WH71_9BACI